MFSTFKNVVVRGISTVVPEKEISIFDELQYYQNKNKVERLHKITGVHKRRVVDLGTTVSDLCTDAANKLFADMNIKKEDIDALVLVVQNPDYTSPATACIVHNNLQLSKNCPAFDINQGCAGYTYGLWVASSLIEGGGCKKVLLLAGDIPSTKNDVSNRNTAPIFGDAGTATLLEYSEQSNISHFSLGADGSGYQSIIIPGGGAAIPLLNRNPEKDVLLGKVTVGDKTSHLLDVYMDGPAIFEFTMTVVPDHISSLMSHAKITEKEVDYLILHQANKQIVSLISDSIGFDNDKAPYDTFENFGNQTIASIPSAICYSLREKTQNKKNTLLLSGFGVGLAWASCIIHTENLYSSFSTYKSQNRKISDLEKKWLEKIRESLT